MKIRTRRRLAAGAAAVAAAVVGGFVIAPPASAAITSVTPGGAFHFESSRAITLTTNGTTYPATFGTASITLTRSGASTDTWTRPVDRGTNPADDSKTATFNFTNQPGGTYNAANPAQSTDGPANPGIYDVMISGKDGMGNAQSDTCTQCFTLLPGSPGLGVSGISVPSLAQGQAANVTISGNDFSRGVTVQVFNGANLDTTINAQGAPLDPTSGNPVTTGVTTTTQLLRRFTVGANSALGPRDIVLTAVNGATAKCSACLTVQGSAASVTKVAPTAGPNDPAYMSQPTDTPPNSPNQRLTFTGTFAPSAVPTLVYAGTGGSASKADLTISPVAAGTNSGSTLVDDFDLRNAAPGSYTPTVNQTSSGTGTCSCTFTVLQQHPSAIDNHGMDSDPNTVGAQSSQAQGQTLTYDITGQYFSKGVKFTASGTGVTNTGVTFITDKHVKATFFAAADAPPGARDVTPQTTDGVNGAPCAACMTVVAAGPTPTPTASSTASPSPTATAPTGGNGVYVALAAPTRVLDSRPDTTVGTTPGLKRGLVTLDLSAQLPGPANAAVLNVTVFGPSAPGFVVVYPAGTTQPATSNVNYLKSQVQANEVVSQVNASKQVALNVVNSETYLIVDVVGYFTSANDAGAGRITNIPASRVYDATTTGGTTVDLTGTVPPEATSAILNVTGTGLTATDADAVVYPAGTSNPGTSNLNFVHNQTQANEVVSKLGTGTNAGKVVLSLSQGTARMIVDVVGYVAPAGSEIFTPLDSPLRLMDSRNGTGTSPGRKTADNSPILTLPAGIPANATGVVLNVTATDAAPGASGYIVVYPNGTTVPPTSNVNWSQAIPAGSGPAGAVTTQANEVITAVGSNRQIVLGVGGSGVRGGVNVVVDITGYLSVNGPASPTPTATATGTASPTPSGSATPSPTPSPTPTGTCIPIAQICA